MSFANPRHLLIANFIAALLLLVFKLLWYNVAFVGRGGALVETMTFNRRVVGSTPALAAT